jgi:glycosyltransferase involved in cell wall biosynthesis
VITTDVAGHSEFIDDGITGYLAEAANNKLFIKTLERAWQERGKWKEIGENAYTKVQAKSTADPVNMFSNKIIDILKKN